MSKNLSRLTAMFSNSKSLPVILYVIGLIMIFATAYGQYFVSLGAIPDILLVYGLPIAFGTVVFGREIFKRAAKNNLKATELGLGLFGALTVIGIFVAVVALLIITQFNPAAPNLLNKPNPELNVTPAQAWIEIGVSFLIVGPAEEFIFRGFMFGGLLSISKGRNWITLAIASSLMFAAVHAYYGSTYGIASVVPFIELVAFGLAMCVTYYWSGGNILIPALIHGAFDATGFLGVATTNQIGDIARGVLIGVGLVFAAIYLPQKIRVNYPKTTNPQTESPPPEIKGTTTNSPQSKIAA